MSKTLKSRRRVFSPVAADLIFIRPMGARLPLTFVAIILSILLSSSGCQKKTSVSDSKSQNKGESQETIKPLQAADLVGYDGTKLRKSINQITNANEKHNQELEKMLESGPDQ